MRLFQITSLYLIFFVIFQFNVTDGQVLPEKNYFAPPVDIPIFLSGNFGEIRATHFHSGIDIKTQQVIGKPVYAAADGYVSRIKIQGGGYGKSIYLTHPNGYVTVYAHLSDYIPSVSEYVRAYQYGEQKFEVDIYPPQDKFHFKQGDLIGMSGNTGNSGGPHLHFEIRDPLQHPINGLLFDFNITDNIPPTIENLALYPVDKEGIINGKNEKLIIKPLKQGGKYTLNQHPSVSGKVGFGLETYDYLNGSGNRCTIYSIELRIDDTTRYLQEMEKFSFDEVKYVSSHIDYEEKILNNLKIHRLFPDPNNHLSIYKILENNGVVEFADDTVHHVEIIVKDSYKNRSLLEFDIQSNVSKISALNTDVDSSFIKTFYYNAVNTYQNPDVKVLIPRNVLFRDINFTYSRIPSDSIAICDTHNIHTDLVPLGGYYELALKAKNIPDELRNKILLVNIGRSGTINSFGGKWEDGFVQARVNKFGKFTMAVDTTAPSIKVIAFRNNSTYKAGDVISFEITDDVSGIDEYSGYIDGHWALFEYDPKSNTLSYTIDKERLASDRKHSLVISVTDGRKNKSVFSGNFIY